MTVLAKFIFFSRIPIEDHRTISKYLNNFLISDNRSFFLQSDVANTRFFVNLLSNSFDK